MKRLALIVLLAGGLCAAALGQTHARTAAAAVPDFTAQGTVNGLNAAVTVTTDQGMVYVVVCDASQAQTEYDIKASNFEGRLHSKKAHLRAGGDGLTVQIVRNGAKGIFMPYGGGSFRYVAAKTEDTYDPSDFENRCME